MLFRSEDCKDHHDQEACAASGIFRQCLGRHRRHARAGGQSARPFGVDAPDFNLDLARELRHRGLKTVQYVCPSVWAWRAERLKKIRQSVDHVLCLFPFEPQLLAQHGIDASFVGHPLANLIPEQADTLAARKALNLATDQQVLAVLPGSRKDEVVSMLPRFLAAIQILQRQHPELLAVMPTAPGMEEIGRAHV